MVILMSIFYRLGQIVLVLGLLAISRGVVADSITEGHDALMRGDESGAVRLWTQPATAGDPEAQFRLGMMYLLGRGVASDDSMAVRWFRLALEKHHIGASLALAQLYLDKAGKYYDPYTAFTLLRDLAEQGVTEAQRYLGHAYRKGEIVSQDFNQALRWFKVAAAKGDIESQAGLGELHRYGFGVKQSYTHAFMWMSLAASAPTDNVPDRIAASRAAIKARDEIEHMLSASDRAEAENLAIACWQAKLQNCD